MSWLAGDLFVRIGWALLNSVWLLGIVAILFAFGYRALHRHSATVRYVFAVATLVLMTAVPAGWFLLVPVPDFSFSSELDFADTKVPGTDLDSEWSRNKHFLSATPWGQPTVDRNELFEQFESTSSDPRRANDLRAERSRKSNSNSSWMRWLTIVWLIGVFVFLIRMILGHHQALSIKSRFHTPVPARVSALFESVRGKMGVGKAVEIAQSSLVSVPSLVGAFRPLILLPTSAVTGLSPQELEAIIAHELAHIRRHDYLVNIIQSAIETFLFFHPAIWWVSNQIRVERENCCDDLALQYCQDRKTYAKALLAISEMPANAQVGLAASGGQLVDRIHRIVRPQPVIPFFATGLSKVALVIVATSISCAALPHALSFSSKNTFENFSMAGMSFQPSSQLQRPEVWQGPIGLASREINFDDAWLLWCAAADGDLESVKRLAAKDSRLVNAQFRYHCPMDLALYGGHAECVRVLLESGTELTEKWGWYGWQRMIGIADEMGHHEIRDLLTAKIQELYNFDPDIELMIQALCDQDLERMTALLDEEPGRIHIADTHGNTALHWAVVSRQIPMIDLLVERGAELNRRNGGQCMPHQVRVWDRREREMIKGLESADNWKAARQRTLELGAEWDFNTAVSQGDIVLVKKLLADNPALVHDIKGHLPSPLTAAAGNLPMTQLLLDHGADPTLPEFTAPIGCALYQAVCNKNFEVAKLLLEHGADPMSYSDSSGDCLFCLAWIDDPELRQRMLDLLNQYSGKEHIIIPQRNDDPPIGETRAKVREVLSRDEITEWQVGHLLDVILHIRDTELLDEYIKCLGERAKSRVAVTDARGYDGELLHLLQKSGATIKPIDVTPKWMGRTILYRATDPALVHEFVSAGGNINSVDLECGLTALSNASESGDEAMVRELLKHGADPNLPKRYVAKQPLTLAKQNGHGKIVELLKAHGAAERTTGQPLDESEFWEAVKNNDFALAKQMLTRDASLAGKNFQPDSLHTDGFPLFQASRQGNLKMVRLLLQHGADPDAKLNVEDPREVGMPLMNALEGGHLDIVHLLLDHQPSLNAHPYCATPFVDRLFNALWDLDEDWEPGQLVQYHQGYGELVSDLFRKSYANYLGDSEVELPNDASENLKLLHRVIEMGGQPTFFTLVRHEQHELIELLLRNCSQEPGTAMDWPQGTVFQNLCYGASWTGYPQTQEDCLEICPGLYTTDVAKYSVERAIRSHNRDGGIDQYHQLIKSQLEYLRQKDELTVVFSNGDPFVPLHWLAEDFIEPRNYGFKCNRLSTPDDLIRLAKLFVEFGYDINSINPKSELSVLETALKENQAEYADFLRQNGAVVRIKKEQPDRSDEKLSDEISDLIEAVRTANVVVVRQLLDKNPKFANARIDGHDIGATRTLLHLAMPGDGREQTSAHLEIAQALLDHGANVNALGSGPNLGQCRPLTIAAWGGHVDLMKLLIGRGAIVDGNPGCEQKGPLHAAAGHGHTEAVELLVRAGAKYELAELVMAGLADRVAEILDKEPALVNVATPQDQTLLHAALETRPGAELVPMLLDRGADPLIQDANGRTALHMAIEQNLWWDFSKVIAILNEQNAEKDIFTAVGLGDLEIVESLLDGNPELAKSAQRDGTTPLFYAVISGRADIPQLLLQAGADPSPKSNRFWCCLTPLHLSLQQKQDEITELLLTHGADVNAHGDCDVRWQPTPLHIAARWGVAEQIGSLLDHGADMYVGGHGNLLGWTFNKERMKLLIDRGLDLGHPACRFLLHNAAAKGRIELFKYLLDKGMDPSVINEQGQSVLDVAQAHGQAELAKELGK